VSDLDWALATQRDVAGARHSAHPARTKGRGDLMPAEFCYYPSLLSFTSILHCSRGIIDKSLPGNYRFVSVVAFSSTVSGCT